MALAIIFDEVSLHKNSGIDHYFFDQGPVQKITALAIIFDKVSQHKNCGIGHYFLTNSLYKQIMEFAITITP